MPKFQVSRAEPSGTEESNNAPASSKNTGAGQEPKQDTVRLDLQQQDDNDAAENVTAEDNPEDSHHHQNLYLYNEDMQKMPHVANFLHDLLSYQTALPTQTQVEKSKHSKTRKKLGTILGVYLPTIQHIFGVLMFVRLAWIVGCMGTLQAFAMVFMCCMTTFVTSISMSAIATNGMVQAGGSYFMISRNLGPECGGAVGICFYLANTFAVDLYILGAIEILLQYIAPSLAILGDIHHNPWNNFRLYGTCLVIFLSLLVAVGVRFVQMFAPFSLACVIVSILSISVGSFQANADTRDVSICLLGGRLMALPGGIPGEHGSYHNHSMDNWCTKDKGGVLWERYCHYDNTTGFPKCDEFFESNDLEMKPGIPGMASGVIKDNLVPKHLHLGEAVGDHQTNDKGDASKGEVVSDITTSFVLLCAIYFPSVTGIMTGSNMSGDLKDPQKSIPVGTICAQLTCSVVYLSFVLFFGSTTEGALLRDKFGTSQGGQLLAAALSWPSHWVVLIGAFCSTVGAALQCLTSAPRLLQAIAADNIIPFLDVFKKTTSKGEPILALIITMVIAEIGIIIANLDVVAPLIDVCFLMCYAFVNLACALQTLMQVPSWRPRFKYYHWSLSLLGVALNLTLSIMAGWYFALAAFAIAGGIYKYVEYKGSEKEWGDGIKGLSMSAAQKALLKLDEGDPHTKNWRPQLLVLCKLKPNDEVKYRRVFNFAGQLKAGKGLTIFAAVVKGTYSEEVERATRVKQTFQKIMEEDKVKGFAKVMVTPDVTQGLNIFVQTVGLGGLRHNAVMVGWPYEWRQSHDEFSWKVFLDTVRAVTAKELALLVPRNIMNFPDNSERLTGTIDIWWIVHDGGMLILLSFLLKQNKVWKNCKLRLFTVAQITDNSIQLKKELETFLYQLRIDAEVHVEEMETSHISAYTVQRTLDMEARAKMLAEMKAATSKKPSIQEILDANHAKGENKSSSSTIPMVTVSIDEETNKYDVVEKQGTGEDEAFIAPKTDSLPMDTLAVGTNKKLTMPEDSVQFTFTPDSGKAFIKNSSIAKDLFGGSTESMEILLAGGSANEGKLKRMHTAVRLNAAIRQKSAEAELVILNFPAAPAKLAAEENYMEYLEALTEGIRRVLMVRGTGKEVVTIYS